MKLLVIGGGGYIGSLFASRMAQQGHDVHVIDLFIFSDPAMFEDTFTCEVKDARYLREADFYGYDAVVNFAALSNDPSGDLDPRATIVVNVDARVRSAILARNAGVPHFILISSCSVYGSNEYLVDEQAPTNPLTTYALANCLAEKELLDLAGSNFCVNALRLGTVFGLAPRMRFDLVINAMSLSAVKQRKITIYGDGKQNRPFIHVEDVCSLVEIVLTPAGYALNGAALNAVSFNMSIAGVAREVIGGESSIEVVLEGCNNDNRNYCASGERAKRLLGFSPKHQLCSGANDIKCALSQGRIFADPYSVRLRGYKYYVEELMALYDEQNYSKRSGQASRAA